MEFEEAIKIVCNTFAVTEANIYSSCRLANVVRARALLIMFRRHHKNETLLKVGAHFKMNHATIIHQLRRHFEWCENRKEWYKARINYVDCAKLLELPVITRIAEAPVSKLVKKTPVKNLSPIEALK